MTLEEIQQTDWYRTRPNKIKKMIDKFPPGSALMIDGVIYHVISYKGNGAITISKHDPSSDYEKSLEDRVDICPDCIKQMRIANESLAG